MINLLLGDCLDRMKEVPDESVDLVLADPPYGTTDCEWDSIIPLNPLWEQLRRIIKPNGAIVLTASQPFSSILVMSNLSMFRVAWVYQKRCASNFLQGKYMPMKEHEDVLVFGKNKTVYFPIMQERKGSGSRRSKYKFNAPSRLKYGDFVRITKGRVDPDNDTGNSKLRLPSSVQEFNNRAKGDRGFHPTQKPVLLMEYFINTYSLEGDTVLDFAMGSGTTGVACKKLNRKFIGIEKDSKFFEIAKVRINEPIIN